MVPLPPTPSAPLTWEKVGAGSGVPKKAAKKKAARAQGQGDAASLGSGTAFDLLEEESPADHGQGGVAQAAMKLQVSDPFWEAEGGQWCCTVTRATKILRALMMRLLLAAAAALVAPGQALQNGFRLPQLGWNSWNHFGCGVTEQDVRATADAFVATGVRAARDQI